MRVLSDRSHGYTGKCVRVAPRTVLIYFVQRNKGIFKTGKPDLRAEKLVSSKDRVNRLGQSTASLLHISLVRIARLAEGTHVGIYSSLTRGRKHQKAVACDIYIPPAHGVFSFDTSDEAVETSWRLGHSAHH